MKSETGLRDRLAKIEDTLKLNKQQEDAIYMKSGGSAASDDSEVAIELFLFIFGPRSMLPDPMFWN